MSKFHHCKNTKNYQKTQGYDFLLLLLSNNAMGQTPSQPIKDAIST
ncbi:hypothetical protein HMPREF3034_00875 [Prevotella sp. DNF00663]|nr:hypothetical protein HMPREF3034_00875 [Prevotella sp. DNF00663]